MTNTEKTTPILVGAGQVTAREPDTERTPIGLIADAARAAAADCGVAGVLGQIQSLTCLNILAPAHSDAPANLTQCLGIDPGERFYTPIGGNMGQWLVGYYADRIAAGELDCALIAGGEALATQMRGKGASLSGVIDNATGERPRLLGDDREPTNATEKRHGLDLPIQIYPLFEQALRGRYGHGPVEHRQMLGELYARFNAVAVSNPQAWRREPLSAADIAGRTPQNRMVGAPYTKHMNAIIAVDQAAALVMMSAAKARQLGIDPERWVYPLAAANAHERWFVSERADVSRSPAIAACGERLFAASGLAIDDIDHIDLYSCFPSAVQMARDALGITAQDPRPLTVTGGLAYHGGPGNNYCTHAIAEIMARIRADRSAAGLVSGVGWYMSKHSLGLYGGRPPTGGWRPIDTAGLQAEIDAGPVVDVVEQAEGKGRIETYTVMHDRTDRPAMGIVLGRLSDGRRFVANTPTDSDLLDAMTNEEFLDRTGLVHNDGKRNLFAPDG
ncbi:acetyl-CoA acetyltransferase [Sinimarinibacterium sp. NLF-5-8]|uniref:acetyl-CoA acetyltransferase n=1 Tax=Sinimarinibacterium sp. NLF-5-8 TaxID=2698684 RepID=UPI00137BC90D|nr:acetyl-CoA acetyltransferase [Sinimarinibacterium sp. NLF-5-8]QHS10043.1 acetyl-CoA acetyltransferase [Sinimarinibacterium sp. NLF-5-8]